MFDLAKELVLGHAELLTGKTIPQQDDELTPEDVEFLAETRQEERL